MCSAHLPISGLPARLPCGIVRASQGRRIVALALQSEFRGQGIVGGLRSICSPRIRGASIRGDECSAMQRSATRLLRIHRVSEFAGCVLRGFEPF